jgi:hypothetical protein
VRNGRSPLNALLTGKRNQHERRRGVNYPSRSESCHAAMPELGLAAVDRPDPSSLPVLSAVLSPWHSLGLRRSAEALRRSDRAQAQSQLSRRILQPSPARCDGTRSQQIGLQRPSDRAQLTFLHRHALDDCHGAPRPTVVADITEQSMPLAQFHLYSPTPRNPRTVSINDFEGRWLGSSQVGPPRRNVRRRSSELQERTRTRLRHADEASANRPS